ncbi:sugar phosphate isomerase/epimerase [Dactylosporangium vinaceum]|uniref:Sugar phosphate isomerase/epimerase family protein n=1 Tax=Dactylosporangium vinaceum TaxID=53362 RepID=A0ABV5M1P7_9ACTN|nr:sugar phosphate isomerase/epimerase family protein [Dactylosporangium vinaceum]UAB99258.1 sugar phosphate isomerase/epimerase [Dactylosporangium vinaceum]
MKFSVFTASTPDWTPPEAAAQLAAQGWDGVEWRITDQDAADAPGFWAGNRATWPLTGLEERLTEIDAVTRGAGLAYSGIGGYARSFERTDVARLLTATAALGAGRVRVTMPLVKTGDYRDLFAGARKDLEWATAEAARLGVTVLVELHHETITASASAALRLIDGLDPAAVGVIHDLGNLIYEGYEDHRAAFQLLGPYLQHVHVKNVAWHPVATAADGSVAWKADWATLREGQADVGAYLRALREHGYDGWITLEDFSTAVPLPERTRDNLAYLRSLL